MTLKDKVVVITGASAGIGASLAALLAERGCKLALIARREELLNQIAAKCGAFAIVADVGERAQVKRAVAAAIGKYGHVDVWINNAGQGISRMPSELTDEDIDAMMQINVKSVLYGMQEILPHFKERNAGHVINISSLLGRVPFAIFRSAYCGAKHFMNALTATFRVEVHGQYPDIQISLVSPGVVATEFGVRALGGGVDSRLIPNAQSPEEVAQVIADVILSRRADAYTRPEYRKTIADYYAAEDLDAVETEPPWRSKPR